MDETKKGTRTALQAFLDKLSPEELKAHRLKGTQASVEAAKIRRAEREEARKKALALIPHLMAEEILFSQENNYQPRESTLERLRSLIESGLTIEQMRSKYFKQMTDAGWHKLTQFLFKNHINHVEDIGLDLLSAKKRAIRTLQRRISMLKKEIKEYKKAETADGKPNPLKRFIPLQLMEMLGKSEQQLIDIELDVASTLHKVGAVGEKSKAASINIHMKIPRPAKNEPKDVTPPMVNLGELIGGN